MRHDFGGCAFLVGGEPDLRNQCLGRTELRRFLRVKGVMSSGMTVPYFSRSAIAPAYGKGWYLGSQSFEP